MLNDN